MNPIGRRVVAPLMAAGLAGAALPLSFGQAASADDRKFSGYSATTTASPVKLEIFEPTIPIPSYPQAEVEFGYTRIIADTSSSRGRASFLWPGDAVGEGSKTVIENLGLPPEVSGPVAAQGYPAQVNSAYPSGPAKQYDQPFPGTVMYSTAAKDQTLAEVGYSSQCELDHTGDGGGGDGPPPPDLPLPDLPGLPGLPDLPGFPGLGELIGGTQPADSGATSSAGRSGSRGSGVSRFHSRSAGASAQAESAADESPCQIPPQAAAIVSFGGYATVSKTQNSTQEALSKSRAAVNDVSLLGGVVQLSGVSAEAVSSSDGAKPTGRTSATYGTISIGGEEFAIGPDGVKGGGQEQQIPGLPDEPNAALAQLGITVTVPKPVYEQKGQQLKSTREGLIVTIDSKTFATALRQLPLQDIVAQLPEEMKDFKKVLQAALNLSPRFVVHLAYSSAKINTVQPLTVPTVPPPDNPGDEGGDDTDEGGGASTGGGGSGGTAGSASAGSTAPASAPSSGGVDGALTDAALASGLPPLFSIPTLLMVLAFGGALAAGSYVRRIGALALGGGTACPHGLDSGLPDLRKIQ